MDRIKSSIEISHLFSQGRRLHTPYFTLIVLPHNDRASSSGGRAAFIAGKKLGNAVWRNKAKRRMREISRQLGGKMNGYDVIFLAKRKVTDSNFSDMVAACEKSFNLIGKE